MSQFPCNLDFNLGFVNNEDFSKPNSKIEFCHIPSNVDFNFGFENHEGFTRPCSINETCFEDIALDDDIFDFYRKEKIKKLKRKFNIQEMKDFIALKKKNRTCIEKEDDIVSNFENKLQTTYGHILSPELRAAISSCFKYYFTDSRNEEVSKYESLIFCIISLMCKFILSEEAVEKNEEKVGSLCLLSNPAGPINNDSCKKLQPFVHSYAIDKGMISASNIKEDQKICNTKMSFLDLNEPLLENCSSSPFKAASNTLHFFPYSGHRHKSGMEMPNISCFNATPFKNVSNGKVLDAGPLKESEKADRDVIDLDCGQKSPKDSTVLSFRTPHVAICNQGADKSAKSPDVVFLHEKKFNEKLNVLCNKTDDLYNDNMVLLRQSYRRAKRGINEAAEPGSSNCSRNYSVVNEHYCSFQRSLTSSSIMQQYSLSKNFPLANHDILIYLAACKVSNMEAYHDSIAADIGGVHLKFGKLGQSLCPGGKIGSFLINILCRKFFLDERPTISMKHYFFSCVADVFMKDSSDFSYVKKCFDGASSVVPLRSVKMLLFPVCHDDHWFVFVVDMKHQHFVFLDSYYCKSDSYQIDARRKLIPRFIRAWDEVVSVDMPFKLFKVVYPHVPKQEKNNRVDCGVFVIKFLELWKSGADLEKDFTQVDIRNIRVQILNDLLFSEHNTADISIVKECAHDALAKGWEQFRRSN